MGEDILETSATRRMLAYSFLAVFANDSTMDQEELLLLENFALEDGVVDAEEMEVLSNLSNRVLEDTVEPQVWTEIKRLKAEHEIA